jgi:hypothetical protein
VFVAFWSCAVGNIDAIDTVSLDRLEGLVEIIDSETIKESE